MEPVAIVGGGISGLSTAYYLGKLGIPFLLFETRPRFGGVIQTERVDGCVVEAGPDSFLSAKPAAHELIRELGLGDDVIGSNDHLRRTYILKNGRLIPMPDGLQLMVPTKFLPILASPLLGWTTKMRMGLEYFRKPSPRREDESVAGFITEHYGAEAVEYLAEPLLAGVYGGDPGEMSLRTVLPRFAELSEQYGSLTRGVLVERAKAAAASLKKHGPAPPLFRTLKGGLGSLVTALECACAGRGELVRGTVETVERGAGGFRLRVDGNWVEAPSVVLACEAHAAAKLSSALDPGIGSTLSSVPYRSSVTVALGYSRKALGHPQNGFGFLIPRRERRMMIACTWVGTKFPNRADEDRALLRCFVGGANGERAMTASDAELVAGVRDELRLLMGVTAEPLFHRVYRWPHSMAQYTVGHAGRIRTLRERLQSIPGLHLAGNAYEGIGIPDCVRAGKMAANSIQNQR